uniref:Anaphase-promoting complex subunit 4 WD40 domain-containing protein n=1 Tax=Solanum lycopersicum TaxID=4081 RepID=K4CUA4_SOLLC
MLSKIPRLDVTTLEGHTSKIFGCAWSLERSFLASGSIDGIIYVCKVGECRPVKKFSRYQIWSTKQDACLHDFREHHKEISTIKWSPTGAGTSNTNQQSCWQGMLSIVTGHVYRILFYHNFLSHVVVALGSRLHIYYTSVS